MSKLKEFSSGFKQGLNGEGETKPSGPNRTLVTVCVIVAIWVGHAVSESPAPPWETSFLGQVGWYAGSVFQSLVNLFH